MNKRLLFPAITLLLVMQSFAALAADPPRGNYVPADLDLRAHPFVNQHEKPSSYRRGKLLEKSGGEWIINVYLPDTTVQTTIDSNYVNLPPKFQQPGTPVLLQESPDHSGRYLFISHDRLPRYLVLLGVALLGCLISGGWITGRSLAGLILGFAYFFFLFLPRVRTGSPIVLEVSLFYLLLALLVLPASLGLNRKALSGIITTVATGTVTLGLLYLLVNWLGLSGLARENVLILDYARRYYPARIADLDFSMLIVASGLIGVLGVVLDVSVDVTSSAAEIAHRRPELSLPDLLKRVTVVSRRLLGTMCNTLLLAYLGSELLLLFGLYLLPGGFRFHLNREQLVIPFVKGLGGVLGFVSAVPLAITFYFFFLRTASPETPDPPQREENLENTP